MYTQERDSFAVRWRMIAMVILYLKTVRWMQINCSVLECAELSLLFRITLKWWREANLNVRFDYDESLSQIDITKLISGLFVIPKSSKSFVSLILKEINKKVQVKTNQTFLSPSIAHFLFCV